MTQAAKVGYRFEGELGGVGDFAAVRDAESLSVAVAVSLRRLPTRAEMEEAAKHLQAVAALLAQMGVAE